MDHLNAIFPGGAAVRVRLKDAAAALVVASERLGRSLSVDFEAISCHAKLRFLVLTATDGRKGQDDVGRKEGREGDEEEGEGGSRWSARVRE